MAASAKPGNKAVDEVDAITNLGRAELVERWAKAHRRAVPKGISRILLERSAAYQVQAARHGGLRPATRRALRSALNGNNQLPRKMTTISIKSPLKPGTRLMREWNGRAHTVEVVEDGFVWEGRMYKSLSAVARQITGARWSGPRFFGL
jgi:hypothetical protein